MKKLWNGIKSFFKKAWDWVLRYPVAIVVSVVLIVVAVLLMFIGAGDKFNVGGLISKLFGRDDHDGEAEKVNKVPDDRVDDDGNEISKGEADKEGWVQREVEIIDRNKNPFRDKSKIKIKGSNGEKKIKLPTGVKDKDIEQVIEVKPGEFKVEVKSAPEKVDQSIIDKLSS